MAAPNLLLTNVLRLLTPNEINELTTTSEGDRRVSLTELMSVDLKFQGPKEGQGTREIENSDVAGKDGERNSAKILPFNNKEGEKNQSKEDAHEEPLVERDPSKLYAGIGVTEYLNNYLFNKNPQEEKVVFLLDEKEKFNKSHKKIKSKEILSLYKKNSQVDLVQQRNLKDDLSKSAESGNLVNKKQF